VAGLTHLLDSDVVIQALRGPGRALTQKLLQHDGALAVSAISVAELNYGALRAQRQDDALDALAEFLDAIVVLEVETRVARVAGAIRADLAGRGTPIGPYDVLLAGHARAEGLVLATGNTREFRRVKDLRVESWR